MAIDKTTFLSIGIPWLITVLVAALVALYGKRDLIDIAVLLALVLLSGSRTIQYFRNGKKEADKR